MFTGYYVFTWYYNCSTFFIFKDNKIILENLDEKKEKK